MKKISEKIFAILLIASLGLVLIPISEAIDPHDFGRLTITLLNQDPDPANQGEYLELRWKVEKTGKERMDDVTFTLETTYPFFFDASDTGIKRIGSWQGYSDDNEYYILYYKIRVDEEALEDTYDINLRVNSVSEEFDEILEYQIRVGEKNNPKFVLGTLSTSPTKLLADSDENKLEVTLENIGDEDAENVVMELNLPEGFTATYGYSDRDNLGTISSGSGATATYYVDIEEGVTDGGHVGELIINYKEANDDENEYKKIIMPFMIPISGKPMFKVESYLLSPNTISADSKVQLSIKVKNVGSKEAESVSVRAFKEASQPFEFDEKSDYIGKLAPGESGEAILAFTVDESAVEKKHILDVEIRGVYNEEVVTNDDVVIIQVNSNTKKGFFSGNSVSWLGVIIIVAFVGIGFFVYRKFRKKR